MVERHGKPSNAFLSKLKPATQENFDKLVEASLAAIIDNQIDVEVWFPYTFKFPADFPRGVCISKQLDGSNVHSIKAKRLLMWLNANGHKTATVEMIGVQKRKFTNSDNEFDKFLNYVLSNENSVS